MRTNPLQTGYGWFHKHTLEAALLVIGLIVVIIMAAIFLSQRFATGLSAPTSVAPTVAPVSLVYGPTFNPGSGTIYDGKAYGRLPTAKRPVSLVYGSTFNPGSGTIYDGKAYGRLPAAKRPISLVYGPTFNPGTGTVYDGR